MKKRTLLTCLTASALALAPLPAQDPVGDDDINGETTFFPKSELTPTDEVIFPIEEMEADTVYGAIAEHPKFTILTSLLKETGLDTMVKEAEAITLLAPTDDAFAKMTEDELTAMRSEENRENLIDLLKFHVLPSKVESRILTGPITVETSLEDAKMNITLRETDGDVYVLVGGLARVIALDEETGNGPVHAIDRVLFPRLNKTDS